MGSFDESRSKPLIVLLRSLVSASEEGNFIAQLNHLIQSFITKIDNVVEDSFIFQLTAFGICSQPALWTFETLESFKNLFVDSFENSKADKQEVIQVLAENWILILKATVKGHTGPDFESLSNDVSAFMETNLSGLDRLPENMKSLLAMIQELNIKLGKKSQVIEVILRK